MDSSNGDLVENIRTGVGNLGGVKLAAGDTVDDDDDIDVLNGAAGVDWFFYDLDEDTLNGKGEIIN